MRVTATISTAALGLALALGACSGADTAVDADEEDTEAAAGDDAAAEAMEPGDYVADETGFVSAELAADLGEKLAAFDTASGNAVHLVVIRALDDRDPHEVAEEMRAQRGADQLILIASGDQEIAVVGQGIDGAFSDEVFETMGQHFDDDAIDEGMNAGVDAVIAHLG